MPTVYLKFRKSSTDMLSTGICWHKTVKLQHIFNKWSMTLAQMGWMNILHRMHTGGLIPDEHARHT